MATETIRRRPRESPIDVAGRAIKSRMRARKRKTRHFQMIEFRAEP